jgi:hypothetical protein
MIDYYAQRRAASRAMYPRTDSARSRDLLATDHGTVVIIAATSEVGRTWWSENVDDDDSITWGDGVVCDHRMGAAIIGGARDCGLVVDVV